ncbi:hypothetical protein [Dinoroseobacter sp. S124A]|uniref:hypothetical protein n=1 Tax=Dinoroseobacter sp. S124A TaxID=3415128 RepID=UPI003C7DF801
MTPDELRDLAKLAELKKQIELGRMQPELSLRQAISRDIASLRERLSAPPSDPSDPVLMLQDTAHKDLLEQKLKQRLVHLSQVEARIAQISPALAQASARNDVAETLLDRAEKDQRKSREEARIALSNQMTS